MKYKIYFHALLTQYQDLDEESNPTGHHFMFDDDYKKFFVDGLEINTLEKNDDFIKLECLLEFEATDEDDAKAKAKDVLEKAGFSDLQEWYLIKETKDPEIEIFGGTDWEDKPVKAEPEKVTSLIDDSKKEPNDNSGNKS